MYKIDDISISEEVYNNYLDTIINRVFKTLPIYETCVKAEDMYPFNSHIEKLITQIKGNKILFPFEDFLTVLSILEGITIENNLNKKKVKSLVFHCIDIIEKMKKGEVKNEIL